MAQAAPTEVVEIVLERGNHGMYLLSLVPPLNQRCLSYNTRISSAVQQLKKCQCHCKKDFFSAVIFIIHYSLHCVKALSLTKIQSTYFNLLYFSFFII